MTKHRSFCQCLSVLQDILKNEKRLTKKLTRDLKSANYRIQTLKKQKQKLIQKNNAESKQKHTQKIAPTFFR
jgi:hypothetical protein